MTKSSFGTKTLSCVVFSFPELSAILDKWSSVDLGLPPHITLLYPWRQPFSSNDLVQLEQVLENFKAFDLVLDRVETFEAGVVYLALKNEEETREILKSLSSEFPDTPLYGGAFPDSIPHVTVTKCSPENLVSLASEVTKELNFPLQLCVNQVEVMEYQEDKQWLVKHTITLTN